LMEDKNNKPENEVNKPAVENISAAETINITHETESMEVQTHPHHVTHKKKWGEYLLKTG
ncbi:MAG: hypothetical protein ABIQ74_09935, partial [Chitinophagales bacterium]